MTAQVAAQPTPHIRYNVLLILTDGEIMDMDVSVALVCGSLARTCIPACLVLDLVPMPFAR